MEAKLVDELPLGSGWQFEPKWDGFRCLAFKRDGIVELRAKSGKSLSRYFPEVVNALAEFPGRRFVIDGELVIEIDGAFSFEVLQMRLHPAASRIAKLAVSTPARLVVFDMLEDTGGQSLLDTPLSERRNRLVGFVEKGSPRTILELSPTTSDRRQAARWLQRAGRGRYDGVVAKRLDGLYEPGERQMRKIKRLRTADCVVGGFRYQSASNQVGSLLLGLYDRDGKLNHVGFTSTISNKERQALTRRLENLRKPPGFTGNAPGGPSRWSTERMSAWEPLRPKLVVEVRFDQVTDGRFRHGTKLVRWRPDKAPTQCGCDQIG